MNVSAGAKELKAPAALEATALYRRPRRSKQPHQNSAHIYQMAPIPAHKKGQVF
jgi:hypothetical protein